MHAFPHPTRTHKKRALEILRRERLTMLAETQLSGHYSWKIFLVRIILRKLVDKALTSLVFLASHINGFQPIGRMNMVFKIMKLYRMSTDMKIMYASAPPEVVIRPRKFWDRFYEHRGWEEQIFREKFNTSGFWNPVLILAHVCTKQT